MMVVGGGLATLHGGTTLAYIESNPLSSPKKERQAANRGWAQSDIDDLVSHPVETKATVNKATGNSATVYYRGDGHYVVKDDITGEIFHVSDTYDSDWIDPFGEKVRPR
jgi:hypothetical protein